MAISMELKLMPCYLMTSIFIDLLLISSKVTWNQTESKLTD